MTDNKNTILAIALSALVLLGWQYFFAVPQEKARQEQLQAQQQKQSVPTPAQPGQPPTQAATPQIPGQAAAPSAATTVDRPAALAASPRVTIATDTLQGSIALKGGRIDDLALVKFRETVDPKSPPIVLLSPSGTADPFYAEFGWTGATGTTVKVPASETVWKQTGSGPLSVGHPVTLTYDNGEGLEFHRTITVDDKYLFTIKDDVSNKGANPVSLFP
jgi:YidC/Oxa1 family membrane protein insertase